MAIASDVGGDALLGFQEVSLVVNCLLVGTAANPEHIVEAGYMVRVL